MEQNEYENYSVLMSVYYKEKPEHLRESLESIFNQSVLTDDFVLVCDGPLNAELDGVIDEYKNRFSDIFNVVKLPENVGLGKALNEGMKHCKNELIGRMDSDDISYPDRFERQLDVFYYNENLDICGGLIEEFDSEIDDVISVRKVPESHEEISKFSRRRNPFNHVSVMFKKRAVISVDGYKDYPLMEDYFLWVRMLKNGAMGYNIQESLVHVRTGRDMYKRRAGWKYFKDQEQFFKKLLDDGYISIFDYLFTVSVRMVSSCAPNFLRKSFFIKFLRL